MGIGLSWTLFKQNSSIHVFHFNRWWNPAVEDRAADWAFRIGQKRAEKLFSPVKLAG
jgi:SNF2 family DNA or RNA helicase